MKKIILALCAIAATSTANAMGFYVADRISYAYTKYTDDWSMGMDFTDAAGIRNKTAIGISMDSELLRGGLRTELEYGIGTSLKGDGYKDFGLYDYTKRININTQTLFINGYYDFHATKKIMPFIGVGFGKAFHRSSNYSKLSGIFNSETDVKSSFDNWAYNLQIGMSYKLTDNWILDAGYRYTNLYNKHYDYSDLGSFNPNRRIVISSHEFLLGARYSF